GGDGRGPVHKWGHSRAGRRKVHREQNVPDHRHALGLHPGFNNVIVPVSRLSTQPSSSKRGSARGCSDISAILSTVPWSSTLGRKAIRPPNRSGRREARRRISRNGRFVSRSLRNKF